MHTHVSIQKDAVNSKIFIIISRAIIWNLLHHIMGFYKPREHRLTDECTEEVEKVKAHIIYSTCTK